MNTNLATNQQSAKSVITSYSRCNRQIYCKDDSGFTIMVIPQEEFEDWLINETEELLWPIYYTDEFGTRDCGYTQCSTVEFWNNYDPFRRIEALNNFINQQNSAA